MPLDERQFELLRLLERYVSRLEAQSGVDPATVETDGPLDASVQRWLQVAVQCCIDLGRTDDGTSISQGILSIYCSSGSSLTRRYTVATSSV